MYKRQGQGYVLEYRGSAIRALSMDGRMTICNMSIEAGARAGMVAPDETTFEYVKGRDHAPQGADWDAAVEYWKTLPTDECAVFDAEVNIDATELEPFVTWGTNPGQGVLLSDRVPNPDEIDAPNQRAAAERALEYMDLTAGTPMKQIAVDAVSVSYTHLDVYKRQVVTSALCRHAARQVRSHARRESVALGKV